MQLARFAQTARGSEISRLALCLLLHRNTLLSTTAVARAEHACFPGATLPCNWWERARVKREDYTTEARAHQRMFDQTLDHSIWDAADLVIMIALARRHIRPLELSPASVMYVAENLTRVGMRTLRALYTWYLTTRRNADLWLGVTLDMALLAPPDFLCSHVTLDELRRMVGELMPALRRRYPTLSPHGLDVDPVAILGWLVYVARVLAATNKQI